MAFRSDSTPPLWLEQQLGFDIYGSKGCLPLVRTNLLVSPIQQDVFGNLEVMIHTIKGMSVTRARNECLDMDDSIDLDKAVLLWDSQFSQQKNSQFWIIGAVDEFFPQQIDFGLSGDSCVMSFPPLQFEEVRIVEFFSGGYGGWHFAAKHLQQCTTLSCRVVGIENDLTACRNYAVTHQVPILSAQFMMPSDILHSFRDSCIIHADVFSQRWMPPITSWRPHIACISAPCQPWSDAGASRGLMSDDGLAFTEVLGKCRFFKPLFLVIEQVEGFFKHPHKRWIFKTCLASGFVPLWSKVFDINDQCPTRRPRWIAVFRHVDCSTKVPASVRAPSVGQKPTPEQFDAVLPFDLTYDERLYPSQQAKDILSDASLLPRLKRMLVRNKSCKEEVFAIRCGTPQDVTPTFMASYGHQHKLSLKHLRYKGCLTHLLRPSQGEPRHWHPSEILIMHMALEGFFIDPDWELAYKFLGNQISTVHAIIALVQVFNYLPNFPFALDLDQILDKALEKRLTVSNMVQIPFAGGMMILHQDFPRERFTQEASQQVFDMIQHGIKPFPKDSFWDLLGFQSIDGLTAVARIASPISQIGDSEEEMEDIPPTVKFAPILPLKIKCHDGDHQYWTYADVTADEILGLWEGAFEIVTSEAGGFQMTPANVELSVERSYSLVCMTDGRITIATSKEKGIDLCKLGLDAQFVYDQFGLVSEHSAPFHAVFLSTKPLQVGSTTIGCDAILQMIQKCQVTTEYFSAIDRITVKFHGEIKSCNALKQIFVQCFGPHALHILGRVCHSDGSSLWFDPCLTVDAAPPSAFRIAATVLLARLLLDTQRCEGGRIVKFKWMNKTLWEGPLADRASLEDIRPLLNLAFAWLQDSEACSFVHHGKNIWNYLVVDLVDGRTKGCVINIIRSFHGRGSKAQQKVQVKNSLAGTLLEEGVELQWITTHVDKVIDTLGVNKLIPISSQPAGLSRVKQIRDLFANAGFPIPPKPKNAVQAPKTLQAKARKQMPATPSPADVQLDCTFLLNEDDSHPKQIFEFRGHQTGIFLTTSSEAGPWLKEGQPLSADELGMVIMGDNQVVTALPKSSVLLPCKDCKREITSCCLPSWYSLEQNRSKSNP